MEEIRYVYTISSKTLGLKFLLKGLFDNGITTEELFQNIVINDKEIVYIRPKLIPEFMFLDFIEEEIEDYTRYELEDVDSIDLIRIKEFIRTDSKNNHVILYIPDEIKCCNDIRYFKNIKIRFHTLE